jgi:hypothetical protein
MTSWHDLAQQQFEGWASDPELSAHEWPNLEDKSRGAVAVGTWLALMSISESLLELVEIADQKLTAEPPAETHLGLAVTDTPRKDQAMPQNQIAPLTVDTAHDISYLATPRDSAGNPIADTLSWSSSNPAVLSITPAADGLSAKAVTLTAGSATVSVTDGIFTDSQDVTVVPGVATLGLVAGVVPKS